MLNFHSAENVKQGAVVQVSFDGGEIAYVFVIKSSERKIGKPRLLDFSGFRVDTDEHVVCLSSQIVDIVSTQFVKDHLGIVTETTVE